jgi:hypothetical protein
MENRIKWIVCIILAIFALFILNKFADKKDIPDQVTVITKDSSNFTVSNPSPHITIPPANYDFSWINQMQSIDSLKMALIQAITEAKTVREYDSVHTVKNVNGDTLAIATIKQTVTDNRLDKYSLSIQAFNKETTIREHLKFGIYGGLQSRFDLVGKIDYKISLVLPKMTIGIMKQVDGPAVGASVEVPIWRKYN